MNRGRGMWAWLCLSRMQSEETGNCTEQMGQDKRIIQLNLHTCAFFFSFLWMLWQAITWYVNVSSSNVCNDTYFTECTLPVFKDIDWRILKTNERETCFRILGNKQGVLRRTFTHIFKIIKNTPLVRFRNDSLQILPDNCSYCILYIRCFSFLPHSYGREHVN